MRTVSIYILAKAPVVSMLTRPDPKEILMILVEFGKKKHQSGFSSTTLV